MKLSSRQEQSYVLDKAHWKSSGHCHFHHSLNTIASGFVQQVLLHWTTISTWGLPFTTLLFSVLQRHVWVSSRYNQTGRDSQHSCLNATTRRYFLHKCFHLVCYTGSNTWSLEAVLAWVNLGAGTIPGTHTGSHTYTCTKRCLYCRQNHHAYHVLQFLTKRNCRGCTFGFNASVNICAYSILTISQKQRNW